METKPRIAYCKIFPPVGVARLGNSPSDFFIGPEMPSQVPEPEGGFKDAEGRIKRQAARFRLYGFDEDGNVVQELTAKDAEIEWSVTLANKKASWHQFDGTERVRQVLEDRPDKPPLRNASILDRQRLVIGPSTGSVKGRAQRSRDPLGGSIFNDETQVTLGELRTDGDGRLLVLGGFGRSGSVELDRPLSHYANNDTWYDDTSDGPVRARVHSKGLELPVQGTAWVIIAPPDYSPHTPNLVTAYDVMLQAALDHNLVWLDKEFGPRPSTSRVSFTQHIHPLLARLDGYQWISRKAQRGHGRGKAGGFLAPKVLEELSDPVKAGKEGSLAKRLFERIRNPRLDSSSPEAIRQANLYFMPPLSGDEGDARTGDPKTWLTLTPLQYDRLSLWAKGEFVGDWSGHAPPRRFEELDAKEQPAALTRAALEACEGGAFYPGIEFTSIIRHRSFYAESFRVSPAYEAGDITRWMALPWQADFYACEEHWWPASRPDDVIPESEFQAVLDQFEAEEKRGELVDLLSLRQPWARGVGAQSIPRPGFPALTEEERTGDAGAEHYRARAQEQLGRFSGTYLRSVPTPWASESRDSYKRRLEEHLAETILGKTRLPLPDFRQGETPAQYRERFIQRVLSPFLSEQTELPRTRRGESAGQYRERLEKQGEDRSVWQGLFEIEWTRRYARAGMNDMVRKWQELGFVLPRRTPEGELLLVESARERYFGLQFRDYFHLLLNIEHHPDFLPYARRLAEHYLAEARKFIDLAPSLPDYREYGRFRYSPERLRGRLEQIYERQRRLAAEYDPATGKGEPLFRTPERVVERIRQLAPYNLLDGAWLQNVVQAGPIDKVRSLLFEIWMDEIGNGDPAQNHANVYETLMRSAGLFFPPLKSRTFADHPDLWDSSFIAPVFKLSMSQFPEAYFPEILGMTLYLEWESNYLAAMVKLYRYHGYDPHFYELHVAIDNAVDGHAAKALEAVGLYLEHVRKESGPEAVEEHWQRVWDGYLAFKMTGAEDWEFRMAHPPTVQQRLEDLIRSKRHYGQLNHGGKRLGDNLINDWFESPEEFLYTLAESDWIVKGEPERSRLFQLTGPKGPMFKIFTEEELALWREWISSLPRDPVGAALQPAEAVVVVLRQLRARALAEPEHAQHLLTGIGPEGTEVARSISWWFGLLDQQPPAGKPQTFFCELLMQALASPQNGWIIPGDAAASRFITELARDGRMGAVLRQSIPEAGNRSAAQILARWIDEGCPMPSEEGRRRLLLLAEPTAEEAGVESSSKLIEAYVQRLQSLVREDGPMFVAQQVAARGRHRLGPGGGLVH